MTKPKKHDKKEDIQSEVDELTHDLKRLRADFENYRKRMEQDKAATAELAKAATIMKLLPIIDTVDRAIMHAPADLADHAWVKGVVSLAKNMEKALSEMGLTRIAATPGTAFDPLLHEAVSMDDSEGEHEVVAEELRAGYTLGENVIRPSMVKVTKMNK